jgi:glycosyltransferase involved in cell wall biosynthesis
MKAPFFTVLIDAYNYGQFIEEAVSSALAQSFPAEEREILVVDDGSTDDTQERLRRFGNTIQYFRKPNGGQASAFNLGFEHARGEVIALLDADDVWLPGKLGSVYETFQKHPDAGMVYHRVHLWNGLDEISEDSYFIPISGRVPESRQKLLQYPMVGTSCLSFRREALKELAPVPDALRFQADAYLTALVIFLAPVAAVPEFLGRYRLHGANLFQRSEAESLRSQVERRMAMRSALQEEIRDWLGRHGHDLRSRDIRAYLNQWILSNQQDGFALDGPGRWRYFRHLLEFPRTYGEIMTPRHRTYSYLKALAALFLGYDRLHLLDEARMKWKQLAVASAVAPLPMEKEKAAAAKS